MTYLVTAPGTPNHSGGHPNHLEKLTPRYVFFNVPCLSNIIYLKLKQNCGVLGQLYFVGMNYIFRSGMALTRNESEWL